MPLVLAIILGIEEVGKFRSNLFVIIVPRAGRRSTFPALPFDGISKIVAVLPDTEEAFDPVDRLFAAIACDRFAQDSGARFTLLFRQTIKPLDIVIGQICKDPGHAIAISYHDIMSIARQERGPIDRLLTNFRETALTTEGDPPLEQIFDFVTPDTTVDTPDVTIVMPCLNEVDSLPHCMGNALEALASLRTELGLSGEVVIADNGSTDGSQALATELGARVVPVAARGYGAALIGGATAAHGRYVLMGDCDGSYNFTEGVAMIARLEDGYDVCMGNRFKGGIAPGAMPWKNRHIGNPALTGILNLFFRSGVGDAHCGLRAIRKDAFLRLGLTGSGMEFASEMVIKAALLKLKMVEVPATLSKDLRDRAPHLRPWRDGWRHLRYLFMLSPTWAFGVPGLAALGTGITILAIAALHALGVLGAIPFGESWIVVAALLTAVGHMAMMMSLASHLYGVMSGYRLAKRWYARVGPVFSLETCVFGGLGLVAASVAALTGIAITWGAGSFAALPSILPVAIAGIMGTVGLQSIFAGLLLAVIAGNKADFLASAKLPADRNGQ